MFTHSTLIILIASCNIFVSNFLASSLFIVRVYTLELLCSVYTWVSWSGYNVLRLNTIYYFWHTFGNGLYGPFFRSRSVVLFKRTDRGSVLLKWAKCCASKCLQMLPHIANSDQRRFRIFIFFL